MLNASVTTSTLKPTFSVATCLTPINSSQTPFRFVSSSNALPVFMVQFKTKQHVNIYQQNDKNSTTVVSYNPNFLSQKTVFFLSIAGKHKCFSATITHAFTISKLNCCGKTLCENKPGRDFSEDPTSAYLQSYVTQVLHGLHQHPLSSN